jgi:CubicO group peptidase (beta-lactamase class C family)
VAGCRVALLLAITALVQGCTPNRTAPLDRYLDDIEAQGEWSGAVLVAEGGRVLLERAARTLDSAPGQRYAPDMAFPIASIAKTLTATAVLQLIEAGAVRLDQPVAEALAGFPYPEITVRHLLSHTSGLPPYNAFFASVLAAHPDTAFTNADFLAGVEGNQVPLRYPPGSSGNYDNVNYLVLALVIERASGMPYQDYLAEHIFGPAAMAETRLVHLADLLSDSTPGAVVIPRIYPHIYSSAPVSAASIAYIVSYWNTYRFLGFGEYVSTTRDLLRFDRALAEGHLLKRATLDSAYVPVRLTDGTPNGGRFGLGWQVSQDASLGRMVLHAGASVGLSTVLVRNLSRDQVVVVFDNGHYTAEEIGMALMRLLNGDSVPPRSRNLATRLGRTLVTEGAERALEEFHRLHPDTTSWHITEDDINVLGYDLMGRPGPYRLPVSHRYDDAHVVFKLNTELYPNSWNVWDSYGEALAAVERREEAIAMYRKAIDLNPESEVSRTMLQKLLDAR